MDGKGAFLALLFLAVGGGGVVWAQGEGGCTPPGLVLPPRAFVDLEPGRSYIVPLGLENPNDSPITRAVATFEVHGPRGWRFELETNPLSLPSRSYSLTHLSVSVPSRSEGEESGVVVLTSLLTCYLGEVGVLGRSAPAVLSLEARMVERSSPLGPIAWGALLLVGSLGSIVVGRARRTPARITFDSPRVLVDPQGGGKAEARIENLRRDSRRFFLELKTESEGWTGFLPVGEISLEGKGKARIWISLKGPPHGNEVGKFVLQARSDKKGERSVEATVYAACRRKD